jgi:AcrR family transcriptional regulator
MAPRPGLTPERIVDVAAEIADRDGLGELSLAKVAGELGVRTPSLYNHVDGLDDLRARLALRALHELGAALQQAAVGRPAEEAVRAIATAYRRYALARPGCYAATVPSAEGRRDEVQAAGAAIVRTVLDALVAYDLDDEAAIHATRGLRAAVHGFAALELAGGFGLDVDVEASFAWLTELLARGIRAVADGPSSATAVEGAGDSGG